jgi:hypothetical protein
MRAPGTSSYAGASAIQACLAPTTFPSKSRNTNFRISNFFCKSLISFRSLLRSPHSSCRIFPCDRLHRQRHYFEAGQNTRRLQVAIALSLRHMHSLIEFRTLLLLQCRDEEVNIYATHGRDPAIPSTYAASCPYSTTCGPELQCPTSAKSLYASAIGAGYDICKRTETVPTKWRTAPI